ncbi:SDR family NAD(P)-dependent oxidoreductase [Vibrio sp. 506]|uniref:SDR family NAD(P)-dependent oxidoreductase n=1 Tax=Vibrio sp. 506 TaxID=3074607 RepID=UPI00296487EC|nr:SDR family NAD(P)-dependent oxidoreductase [Vibrio sp. 506]MDW2056800.1 SDR family NAD(P)-dependent oxidoreductase [Vibrio sp. 506]
MKKKILITGGGGDLAKALYDELKDEFEVSLPTREELDVSSIESVDDYFDERCFDIVINNAGTLYSSLVKDSEPTLWIRDISVNLIGSYLVARRAIQKKSKVKIINVSSTAAYNNYKDWTSYCASKAGVMKLSLGLVDDGYDVIMLCPGAIETKLRNNLDIINNNIMTIEEGIAPFIKAVKGDYKTGDIVFYRKNSIEIKSGY